MKPSALLCGGKGNTKEHKNPCCHRCVFCFSFFFVIWNLILVDRKEYSFISRIIFYLLNFNCFQIGNIYVCAYVFFYSRRIASRYLILICCEGVSIKAYKKNIIKIKQWEIMCKKENVFKNIYQCRRRNVTKQHKIDPFSPLFVVCVSVLSDGMFIPENKKWY